MFRKLLFFVILFISILTVTAQTPLTEAIDFETVDVHGDSIHLFDILDEGKFVLIDFFFITCVPCQEITPFIIESYEVFGCNSGDVVFMSVSGLEGDTDEECIEYDETYGIEYPTISGAEGGGAVITGSMYRVGAYPTLILIGPDRQIIVQHIWPVDSAYNITQPLLQAGIQVKECPVGIAEPVYPTLQAYPNPASGEISIELPDIFSFQYRIINSTGVEVISGKRKADKTVQTFDLTGLPDGIYFVYIVGDNHYMAKFIID